MSVPTDATKKGQSIEKGRREGRKKEGNCLVLCEVAPELRPSKGELIENQMTSTPKHVAILYFTPGDSLA